jgi:hypothetical protein
VQAPNPLLGIAFRNSGFQEQVECPHLKMEFLGVGAGDAIARTWKCFSRCGWCHPQLENVFSAKILNVWNLRTCFPPLLNKTYFDNWFYESHTELKLSICTIIWKEIHIHIYIIISHPIDNKFFPLTKCSHHMISWHAVSWLSRSCRLANLSLVDNRWSWW